MSARALRVLVLASLVSSLFSACSGELLTGPGHHQARFDGTTPPCDTLCLKDYSLPHG